MESSTALQRHPFRGDADADHLNTFLRSETQYDGDPRWTSGTSLKATWLGLFEFLNYQPVSEYWTDTSGDIAACTILLPTGWRLQCRPDLRSAGHLQPLAERATRVATLLGTGDAIATQAYTGNSTQREVLAALGYAASGSREVFMQRSLTDAPIRTASAPPGVDIGELDRTDALVLDARALAQGDAFGGGNPDTHLIAWQRRNIHRELAYADPASNVELVARDGAGQVLAFAAMQIDRTHHIAEFEPIGTRTAWQRRGLCAALIAHGMRQLQDQGINSVVVRTDTENHAAVRAYTAAGFEIQDELLRYVRSA